MKPPNKAQNVETNPHLGRAILLSIGIALSVIFVILSVRRLNWPNVFDVIANVHLFPWLGLSVASYLIGHLFRGLRTRLLVSRDAKLSLIAASNIVVVGYAVNNILPARAGELARSGMLSERTGISISQALTVTFLERVLDGLGILLLFAVSVPFLNAGGRFQEWIYFPAYIFGSAAVLILFVAVAPNLLTVLTSRAVSFMNPRWHDAAVALVASVVRGVSYLGRPRHAAIVLCTSIILWLLEGGLFLFLFPAFGLKLEFWPAIFVMAATNLGILLPSSPGFIGSFHFFCMQSLMLMGIAKTTAISFAILVHLAFYFPVTLWGGAVILWYGIGLGRAIHLARKAKPVADLPQHVGIVSNILAVTPLEKEREPASAFILKLTEAIVPMDSLPLSNPENVVTDTAVFVQGQIRNLPKKYSFLFSLGMFAFVVFAGLRYFRRFSTLPLNKRVKLVDSWAYGRLSLTRQLFRVVRSTALLAFYEHPVVAEALENGPSGIPSPSSATEQ